MMVELAYEKRPVNPARLHQEIAALGLGDAFAGVSVTQGCVRIHLIGELAGDSQARIAAAVAAHDPAQLTAGQQAAADRRAERARLRDKPWPDWTPEDKDAYLGLLAAQGIGLAGED